MRKLTRLPVLALSAALLVGGAGAAAGPAFAVAAQSSPAAVTTLTGTFKDGATYKIEVPADWNGTLFLYSHGYVTPGSANPATDVGDPVDRGVAARPRLRAGRLVLRHHRLGHPAGAARPDPHPECVRPEGGQAHPDDRVGPFTGRHYHGRPDPDLSAPVQRGPADVRCAVRRGRHLEHGAGCRVRLPAADRPVGPGRQHHDPVHQPDGQPDQRRAGRRHRAGQRAGPGPAGPGRRAG